MMKKDQFLEFSKAFDRAAKHVFSPARAENLLSYFSTEPMQSPADFESDADAIRVRHTFAVARHTEVIHEIACAPQGEPPGALLAERDALQDEIESLAPRLKSPAILKAYRGTLKKAHDARQVWGCIFDAVRDEALAIYLKPAISLNIRHFEGPQSGRFIPSESVGEFTIANEVVRAGLFGFFEPAFHQWLETIAVTDVRNLSDNGPDAERLYRERLADPTTRDLSKEVHFAAVRKLCPGLTEKKFREIRAAISKEPGMGWITHPGRRPKSPN